LASRLKSGTTVLTLIMKLTMHYKILRSITRRISTLATVLTFSSRSYFHHSTAS
jgi:AraC-like DNA-binding protein